MTSTISDLLAPTSAKPKGNAAPTDTASDDGAFSVALSAATQNPQTPQSDSGAQAAGQGNATTVQAQLSGTTAMPGNVIEESGLVVPLLSAVETNIGGDGAVALAPDQADGAPLNLVPTANPDIGAAPTSGQPVQVAVGQTGADAAVAPQVDAKPESPAGRENAVLALGATTARTKDAPEGLAQQSDALIGTGAYATTEFAADNESGLLLPGLLNPGSQFNVGTQSSSAPMATTVNPSPATPNTAVQTNPILQQIAAGLSLDPRLQPDSGSGQQMGQGQTGDGKASARAAAMIPSIEAKPTEGGSGANFANALGATSANASTNSAKEVASASPKRPSRPALPTPATAQIAVHIVRATADGISRFNVQLRPAELGRVEVQLEVTRDGAVHARVIADRQETVDHLQRDSRALERALQDAGLKADSQNLHFSLRGGQKGHDTPENRGSVRNDDYAIDDPAEVAATAMAARWSDVAGSSGALDIRV